MSYIEQQEKLERALGRMPKAIYDIFPERTSISLLEEIGDSFNLTFTEIGELCELVRQVITKERQPENFEAGLKEKLDEDNQPKVGEIVAAVNEKIFVKLLQMLGMKALLITLSKATVTNAGVQFEDGREEKYQGEALIKPNGEATAESATPSLHQPSSPLSTLNFQPSTGAGIVPLNKILPPVSPPVPPPKPFLSPVPPQPLSEFASPQSSYFSSVHSATSGSPTDSGPTVTTPSASTLNPKPSPLLVEPSHERLSDNPTDSFLKMLSDKLSEKELQIRFDKLPYALKTALRSVDSAKKVVDIGRKYALHVDKLGELGTETGLVILGITHPSQFLPRLARKLDTSEEKVKAIAQEINNEVFLKIREALKQVNGESVQPLQNALAVRQTQNFQPNQKYQDETVLKQTPPPPIGSPDSAVAPNQEEEKQKEVIDREALLKDIENPMPTHSAAPLPHPSSGSGSSASTAPTYRPTNQPAEQTGSPTTPTLPLSEPPSRSPLTTAQTSQPQKPPEAKPETKMSYSAVSASPSELTPQRASATPEPQSIVDQKLSSTVAAPKSENRYTVDPYREAIE